MNDSAPQAALPTFLDEIETRWKARQRACPSIVYHYTRATNLRRILESQRVWATTAAETNDTSELLHSVARWRTMINRHATAASLPEYRVLYPPQALTFDYLRSSKATSFVASFSGREDDLSQWNLYAGEFTGVAIGFDTAELERLDLAGVAQNVGFFGIEYEEEAQDEFFDWLLTRWEKEAAPSLAPGLRRARNPFLYIAEWFGTLASSALSLFPRMKNRSFWAEDEWRVAHLHVSGAQACCEVESGRFRTHVALDLGQLVGRLPIVCVWLAPAVANAESEELVRRLLCEHGYDIPIQRSRTPLRIESRRIEL